MCPRIGRINDARRFVGHVVGRPRDGRQRRRGRRHRHRAGCPGPSCARLILITHLDADHAGGLADFPEATIHVTGAVVVASSGALPGFGIVDAV
ncbi:MAG: MBL fold metallo-hydrolase, partial [Acidimicrobiales bacterium]